MLFMVNLDVVRGMRYGLFWLHRSLKIQHKLSLLILAGPTHGPRRTAHRPEIPAPFREPGRGCPWLRENQVAAMAGSGHLTEPAHGAVTASGSMARFGATRVRLGEINGLAVSQHAGRSRECGAHETRFTVVVRGRGAALIAMGQQAPDGPLNAGRIQEDGPPIDVSRLPGLPKILESGVPRFEEDRVSSPHCDIVVGPWHLRQLLLG
jgi:hypothetical protein